MSLKISSFTFAEKASCYHDKMFLCPTGNCINRRYMCDGHRDCKNGADEAEVYCGLLIFFVFTSLDHK